MAESLRYVDCAKRLEREGPRAAYLFAGPESLLRDRLVQLVREHLERAAGGAAERERFHGGESPLSAVAAALGSPGLFASARLVTLSDLERASRAPGAERENLIARLGAVPSHVVLIAWSDLPLRELRRKGEFLTRLADLCTVVELWHPREEEALSWLADESRQRNLGLTRDAAALLLSRIGPDLQELSRELEKLALLAVPGTSIGAQEVVQLLRAGRSGSVWAFCDAVTTGRRSEAIRLWESLRGTEEVLRVQWLIQQKAREALGGSGSSGSAALALRAYDLERGIKSGRIPPAATELALECVILGGTAGSRVDAMPYPRSRGRHPSGQNP